jgi:two-component system, NarL family, nitrate/nitrite response regulator NarL
MNFVVRSSCIFDGLGFRQPFAPEDAMRAVGTSSGLSPESSAPGTSAETQSGSGGESAYRLMILSDIRFLREGLAEILARDGAFAVVGIAGDLDQALALSGSARPQIILIDAALPDGLVAARSLGHASLGVPLVAIALAETETDVIAWAEAGISGYVPRSAGLGDLAQCLSAIVRGEQFCSTRVASGLLRWIATTARDGGPRPRARPPVLTAREEQVVRLICTGLSNKEISRLLNIGLATTKSHVHNLLAKLELERRAQIVRWSRDNGIPFRNEA